MDTYRGEFEESLSLNLYSYCSGNPVNYVDPSGHKIQRHILKIDINIFTVLVSPFAGGKNNKKISCSSPLVFERES